LKLVGQLSCGERLRALLACVLLSLQPPQLILLDEPTNHLDFESLVNLELALQVYRGALIVISHDQQFLQKLNLTYRLAMPLGELSCSE